MSCTICGKATGPGALLCRPCKAALKRARQFTVLDIPGTPPAVTMAGLPVAPRRRAVPSPPKRKRNAFPLKAMLAVAAALLALAALAYVGQLRGKAAVVASPAATLAPKDDPHSSPDVAGNPEQFAEIAPALPPARAKPSAPRANVKVATAAPAPSIAAQAAIPEPAAAPPIETRSAPVTVAVAPALDRWQIMADALARCARESGFTGFICDQRVRIDSCEGYWGRVPQCPLPSSNPP
jgi:hypothetical protein